MGHAGTFSLFSVLLFIRFFPHRSFSPSIAARVRQQPSVRCVHVCVIGGEGRKGETTNEGAEKEKDTTALLSLLTLTLILSHLSLSHLSISSLSLSLSAVSFQFLSVSFLSLSLSFSLSLWSQRSLKNTHKR